jgi:hypothetical protein
MAFSCQIRFNFTTLHNTTIDMKPMKPKPLLLLSRTVGRREDADMLCKRKRARFKDEIERWRDEGEIERWRDEGIRFKDEIERWRDEAIRFKSEGERWRDEAVELKRKLERMKNDNSLLRQAVVNLCVAHRNVCKAIEL